MREILKRFTISLFIIVLSLSLYLLSRRNYLLFHAIAETYSIIIAAGIFFVAWNSRKHSENDSLVFLGISYLYVAGIDFLHTLSYQGMNVFTDYSFYANQLWVCARFIESSSLFAFVLMGFKKIRISFPFIFVLYTTVLVLCILSILVWKIFPVCFIKGVGQTQFKIISEIIICFILLVTLVLLIFTRMLYDRTLFNQIAWSIMFTIASEFCFILYTDNYGITNVVGHLFKILSFYLIYRSVIVNTMKRPFDILYTELNEARAILQAAMDQSSAGIAIGDAPQKKLRYVNRAGLMILGIDADIDDPDSAIRRASETTKILPNTAEHQESQGTDLLTSMIAATVKWYTSGREYIIRRDGSPDRIVLANSTPVKNAAGAVTSGILIFQDITESKKSEQRVIELLKEKNIILKEVHHRIKNNMNTIFSLLTLQAEMNVDSKVSSVLIEAASRVESMGILYDMLYRSGNESVLPLRDYLNGLVDKIISIFGGFKNLKVESNIDDIVLPANILTPMGIIVNELITNSMKYAFDMHSGGTIYISVILNENQVIFTYSDSGRGIPESVAFSNSTGFGMQLISMLVCQIGGKIAIERDSGTRIVIRFRI